MKKYFALPDKAVDISDTKEIKNFDTLKTVVEDMTKHKDDLGIQGVFGSTSFAPGEDWRWQTHLMNIPVYGIPYTPSPSVIAISLSVSHS